MGGSSGGSSGIDTEYNDRMATIAENYKDIADQYFNFYKYGTFNDPTKPMIAGPKTAGGGATQIPNPDYNPNYNPEIQNQNYHGTGWENAGQAQNYPAVDANGNPRFINQPGGGQVTNPDYDPNFDPNTATSYANMEKAKIAANMQLIPLQTKAGTEAINSALTYDPMQIGSKASNTVMQQGGIQQGALRREAGRTGVDPNSGQYTSMLGDLNMATQKNAAFAKTTAEQLAEQEKWKRLSQIGLSIQ